MIRKASRSIWLECRVDRRWEKWAGPGGGASHLLVSCSSVLDKGKSRRPKGPGAGKTYTC